MADSETAIKEIEAVLKLNTRNEEVIEVVLNGIIYELNFTKEDQSYLRDFFKQTLEIALNDPFIFKFSNDGTVQNAIIIKVADEYIKELNTELANCLSEILQN